MIKIPYFTNSLPNGSFALRRCPVGQVHRHFRWFWTGEQSTTSPPTSTRLCLASAQLWREFKDGLQNKMEPELLIFKLANVQSLKSKVNDLSPRRTSLERRMYEGFSKFRHSRCADVACSCSVRIFHSPQTFSGSRICPASSRHLGQTGLVKTYFCK